jgi:hypothetical protein
MASLYADFEEGIFAWISINFPSGPNVFFVELTLNASIFIGGDAIEYTRWPKSANNSFFAASLKGKSRK